jgi:hypothetical protein
MVHQKEKSEKKFKVESDLISCCCSKTIRSLLCVYFICCTQV